MSHTATNKRLVVGVLQMLKEVIQVSSFSLTHVQNTTNGFVLDERRTLVASQTYALKVHDGSVTAHYLYSYPY